MKVILCLSADNSFGTPQGRTVRSYHLQVGAQKPGRRTPSFQLGAVLGPLSQIVKLFSKIKGRSDAGACTPGGKKRKRGLRARSCTELLNKSTSGRVNELFAE